MSRFARAAGSSSGFTLVEVLCAVIVLAAAAGMLVTIYIRCVEQTTAARDLNFAGSVARNALNEGLAGLADSVEGAELPERQTLALWLEADFPEEETALFDTFHAVVRDLGGSRTVVEVTMKRALYQLPEEDEEGNDDEERGRERPDDE